MKPGDVIDAADVLAAVIADLVQIVYKEING
jgi:hypothetical protein